MNTNAIQGTVREYFKNLYSNKLEYLAGMGKFLDAYDVLKLNQGAINHYIRSIPGNEIKAIVESSSKEVPRTRRIHC
jgi:hypothetical protein